MVSEEKAPLPTNADHTANLSKPLDSALAYDTDAFLEDAVFSQYSVDRMKLLLTEYGSVSALIHMDNKGIYYRPETAASCYPFSGNVNHAVTVVGWDDDYSKDNFPSASKVMNNGAWIVKNSYGASWGKEGIFIFPMRTLPLPILCVILRFPIQPILIIIFMTAPVPELQALP